MKYQQILQRLTEKTQFIVPKGPKTVFDHFEPWKDACFKLCDGDCRINMPSNMDPHGQCLAMITDPDGDHTGGLVGIFDIEDKKGWVLKKRPTDPL